MSIYINRAIYPLLEKSLKKPYISAILGPRQTGKTTLLEKIKENILTSGEGKNIISFNLDDLELRTWFKQNPKVFFNSIEEQIGLPLAKIREKVYIFIDEVQKVPEIFELLKILYDKYSEKFKIFISGSSSFKLQKKASETLAGRIRFFYLYPLTISELVSFYLTKPENSLIETILQTKLNRERFLKIQSQIYSQKDNFSPYWNNLLLFGGLPGIFTEKNREEKLFALRDFIRTYIERDIRDLPEVGNIDLFSRIFNLFLSQDSQVLNFSKLSSDFDISRLTIKKYFSILQQTYVLKSIPPFVKKFRQQLVKSPKIVFFDNGLINYQRKIYSLEQLKASNQIGQIFENIIINNLLNYTANQPTLPSLYFWRDYLGHEIDLIIETVDSIIPIEITYQPKISKEKIKNFKTFFNLYPKTKFGLLVYSGNFQEIQIENHKIFAIPYWMWW